MMINASNGNAILLTKLDDDSEIDFNEDIDHQYDENESIHNNKYEDCRFCLPCVFKILWKFNLYSSAYSNVYLLYKCVLTLACTQVYYERSFSKLKIIKNRLRSTLSEELLNALMLLSIEHDLIPDINYIINLVGT